MDAKDELLITVATFPASDNWGFVGVVSVGDQEAYRTIRAYTTPGEALAATPGAAGRRARRTDGRSGMAGRPVGASATLPRRTELEFGLQAKVEPQGAEDHSGG